MERESSARTINGINVQQQCRHSAGTYLYGFYFYNVVIEVVGGFPLQRLLLLLLLRLRLP